MPQAEERITRLRESCASLPHGRRARYVAGCRCLLCRAAHSRYNCERERAVAEGRANPLVSAEAARAHLAALSTTGVGYKSAASAANVAKSIVLGIITGRRPNIRKDTERRLLAVDVSCIGDSTLIDARPTWKILNRLLADGYTKRQLAEWMGLKHSIQFHRDRITARNAARVERLVRLLEAGKLRRDR